MNHIAAMEEQVVSERMRQKLNEVNMAAQSHLGPIQDHVNFSLQVFLSLHSNFCFPSLWDLHF